MVFCIIYFWFFVHHVVNIQSSTGSGNILINQLGFTIAESTSTFEVQLTNLTFCNNNIIRYYPATYGAIVLDSIPIVVIENCSFLDNGMSAITSINTNLQFKGINQFVNNSNKFNGGAIYLSSSYIILYKDSQLVFSNNRAENNGGAIYSERRSVVQNIGYGCFFQFVRFQTEGGNIFIFSNNTAGNAGSTVYGGDTDARNYFLGRMIAKNYGNYFVYLSTFNESGDSIISSSQRNVCFCNDNGTKSCDIRSLEK